MEGSTRYPLEERERRKRVVVGVFQRHSGKITVDVLAKRVDFSIDRITVARFLCEAGLVRFEDLSDSVRNRMSGGKNKLVPSPNLGLDHILVHIDDRVAVLRRVREEAQYEEDQWLALREMAEEVVRDHQRWSTVGAALEGLRRERDEVIRQLNEQIRATNRQAASFAVMYGQKMGGEGSLGGHH